MSDREDAMTTRSTPDDGDELAPTWTHDGHVDEGTIHTWLDGAFDASHAALIETHVSACAECSANVAEARGLIAGASRVVRSLDVVPSGVVPQEDVARTASRIVAAALAHTPSGRGADLAGTIATPSEALSGETSPAAASRGAPRPWYLRAEWRAAAALLVVVGGGSYVWSHSPDTLATVTAVRAERDTFDSAFTPQSSAPMAPSVAPTSTSAASVDAGAEAAALASATVAPAPAPAPASAPAPAPAPAPAAARPMDTRGDLRPATPRADDNRAVPLRREPDQQAKVAAAVPPSSDVTPTVGRIEARVAGGVASPTENRLRDSTTRDLVTRELATRDLVARDFASREGVRDRLIVGRVLSQQALPIEGAAVSIVGTTIGVMTDARGDFVLRSRGDSASLQVRRLGYESARLSLRTPLDDTVRANVTLKASNQTLSAVVVQSASQPLQERRQVGTALAGSPTPAARTAPASAQSSAMQCWVLQPSDPNTADLGSPAPRAVLMSGLSTDVGADREVPSQWVNWPVDGRNTSVPFVRDDRGRYRGTGVGSGAQWTLELTRRGNVWDVVATRAAASVEQKVPALTARFVLSQAADGVCK